MTAATDGISRVIVTVVAITIRKPLVTAVTMLGLSGGGLFYVGQNLAINTDTADMISESLPWRQDFIAYRDSFPLRDQNIVAVIDGLNGDISMSYAREFARVLENEPALFPTVFLPGSGEFFEQNGLLYAEIGQLEQLIDRLIAAQPLLGRLSEDVSGAGLLAVLRDSIEQGSELPAGAAEDLDRIFLEIAATLDESKSGERRPIAWGGLIGTEAESSTRQLVLIRPALDFSLARPARAAIERMREIGDALAATYGDRVQVRLTGTLAMEHEELTSVIQSASTAGVAALVMVIVALFWALRSPILLFVAVVVLLSGLSLTAAFAAVTVGELNLLSVAFAVLYIGLGVDFILHMSLRLKELCGKGRSLDDGLIETARGVGSSLLICAVTTAAGFLAFIPTDFVGVSELGLISGGGMIISLIVSVTLLPALIRLTWRRGALRVAAATSRQLQKPRRPLPAGLVTGVAAVIALISLVLLPGLQFNGNPIDLRDPDSESIRALEDLAVDREAPLFNLAVLVPDSTAAEAIADRLAALPTVETVQTVSRTLVPDDQLDKLDLIDELDFFVGPTLAGFEPAPPDARRMTEELGRLRAQLASLDAPGAAAAALHTASAQWLDQRRVSGSGETEQQALALEADLIGNLIDQMSRLERALGARAFDRDDLSADLLNRWVNAAGEELVEVVPREDLNDNEAAARFVSDVRSVAPRATGLPVVYEEAAATVTRAFMFALAYAFVIVSLLLLYFLRSARDTLLVLVPILFAAVVTAGASVAIGLPFNFANIIALPLLVGVGVDSGIHMVHRMRTEPPSDHDPLHTSTSRAVFLSALTTIASFGNLGFSTHLGMASMGQLLTLGMVMSVIAVLVLLPALMRLVRAV
jgi:hopanoid biosynthesis associated RND transporter like protein HpnN